MLPPCQLASLRPLTALLGVKDGAGGARFRWGADANAAEYHLNTVSAKTLLRDTDPTSPRQAPRGQGVTECTAIVPALTCTDAEALADPRPLLFYQVLSACGSTGADEGPVCPATVPCP